MDHSVEIVRKLTAEDLERLKAPKGVVAPPLKRIKDIHHWLARLVAQGIGTNEIAARTGYSISRISILKNDPTFENLVAGYRARIEEIRDEIERDHFAKLQAIHADLSEEYHDRLLDTPELFSNDQILDGLKYTADRIGFGPTHKTHSTNLNIDLAGRVAAGRQRADRLSAAPAVKQVPVVLPLPGPVSEED